jgi:hypothetical protein
MIIIISKTIINIKYIEKSNIIFSKIHKNYKIKNFKVNHHKDINFRQIKINPKLGALLVLNLQGKTQVIKVKDIGNFELLK